jgi:photosystem II stability/assembly factor-like uncharacterized protein
VLLLMLGAGATAIVLRPWQSRGSSLPDGLSLPSILDASFADAMHGYLVLGQCPTEVCETWVGATDDAGRSWRAAIVPGLTFPRDNQVSAPRGRLLALDATHAVIEGYHDSPWGSPDHHRWYTSDGGRSWADVPVLPVATVDELPADGHADADSVGDDAHTLVVRIIRHDGTSAVLAAPPQADYPISMLLMDIASAPDGSRWIQGGDIDRLSIFVTRDRGRSWRELPLPAGTPVNGHGYHFFPTDGATLYLTDEGAFRAWRSTDAGQNWTELTVPFDNGGMDFGLNGFGLRDGRLVVVKPVVDAQSVSVEYLAVTPTGSGFEPVESSILRSLTGRPTIVAQGTAMQRGGPYGVQAVDGTWTALPFPCRTEC